MNRKIWRGRGLIVLEFDVIVVADSSLSAKDEIEKFVRDTSTRKVVGYQLFDVKGDDE